MLKAQKQFLTETKSGEHDPLETSGLLKMEIDSHDEVQKREEAIAVHRVSIGRNKSRSNT